VTSFHRIAVIFCDWIMTKTMAATGKAQLNVDSKPQSLIFAALTVLTFDRVKESILVYMFLNPRCWYGMPECYNVH
jgi:hypothetical protein